MHLGFWNVHGNKNIFSTSLYLFTIWSYWTRPSAWIADLGVMHLIILIKDFMDMLAKVVRSKVCELCMGTHPTYWQRGNSANCTSITEYWYDFFAAGAQNECFDTSEDLGDLAKRSPNYYMDAVPVCDKYLVKGWYFALGHEMSTTPPLLTACGTTYPYWLNGNSLITCVNQNWYCKGLYMI